jgi:serine/threonine-protein kinase
MSFHDPLSIGAAIDAYRIEEQIARSGMASLYRAVDTRDGRTVALKIPHPDLEADVVLYDRFKRENEIGIKLDHPRVMHVFAEPDGARRSRVYMVMEWCAGRPLRSLLAQGRLSEARALHITEQILEALAYIHAAGVVHRDLKPENIMVDDQDNIKLIDFGIAGDAAAKRLTYANFTAALGTPDYISPEQVKGRRGDARSDLYAVGVLLYEMLSGKLPFHGDTPIALMNERLLNHPVPPRVANPEISPELQEVIYRALERDPKNRYAHARDFLSDLKHLEAVGVAERSELANWQGRRSPGGRHALFLAGLALIPVVLLLLLYLVARHR